jgi:uncharacterized DUF497 family protein
MLNWKSIVPSGFEYDWDNDKLSEHNITFEEARQVFFNERNIRPNKRFNDRFQCVGRGVKNFISAEVRFVLLSV